MACRQRAGRAGGTFALKSHFWAFESWRRVTGFLPFFSRHVSNVEESTFSTGVNVKCVFLWGGGGSKAFWV